MIQLPKEIVRIMQSGNSKYLTEKQRQTIVKILQGMTVSFSPWPNMPEPGDTTREIPEPIPISSGAEMLVFEILATLAHPNQKPTPFIAMLRDKKLWLSAAKSLEKDLAEAQVTIRNEITALEKVAK
jgi:hypothetical protein